MRIGGGTGNGRRLRTVTGRQVRPTSGRVRQALFNMLRERTLGGIFVDLFAGTGSVGLEALSHGAKAVYFVEHDRQALAVLRANIDGCAMAAQTIVVAASLPQALQQLPVTIQADMIFLDPPYASTLAETVFETLDGQDLLAPDGIVIWQHAVGHDVPATVLQAPLWKQRRYGATQLSIYTAGVADV
jgi:16S rRNA (guanine(966)-N(2))-methyltransferase RsmD